MPRVLREVYKPGEGNVCDGGSWRMLRGDVRVDKTYKSLAGTDHQEHDDRMARGLSVDRDVVSGDAIRLHGREATTANKEIGWSPEADQ